MPEPKLTAADRVAIWDDARSYRKIAASYGVSLGAVQQIKNKPRPGSAPPPPSLLPPGYSAVSEAQAVVDGLPPLLPPPSPEARPSEPPPPPDRRPPYQRPDPADLPQEVYDWMVKLMRGEVQVTPQVRFRAIAYISERYGFGEKPDRLDDAQLAEYARERLTVLMQAAPGSGGLRAVEQVIELYGLAALAAAMQLPIEGRAWEFLSEVKAALDAAKDEEGNDDGVDA